MSDPNETGKYEIQRYDRVQAEKHRILKLPPRRAQLMLVEVVGEIYVMLADHGEVPDGLHPADILAKYIARGNINKDGSW